MRHHHRAGGPNGLASPGKPTVSLQTRCYGTNPYTQAHSYGVVRVHSRQYDYVLSDAETTQANIRALLKAVKSSELDPNARKARYEERT